MSDVPEWFRADWQEKAAPKLLEIGRMLDGLDGPLVGGILGHLLAMHLASIPADIRPRLFASFLRMTTQLLEAMEQEAADGPRRTH